MKKILLMTVLFGRLFFNDGFGGNELKEKVVYTKDDCSKDINDNFVLLEMAKEQWDEFSDMDQEKQKELLFKVANKYPILKKNIETERVIHFYIGYQKYFNPYGSNKIVYKSVLFAPYSNKDWCVLVCPAEYTD